METRVEGPVAHEVRREQEGLEEPGGVGQVPLGRAGVRHRLRELVLRRQRAGERLGRLAHGPIAAPGLGRRNGRDGGRQTWVVPGLGHLVPPKPRAAPAGTAELGGSHPSRQHRGPEEVPNLASNPSTAAFGKRYAVPSVTTLNRAAPHPARRAVSRRCGLFHAAHSAAVGRRG